jgi:hypothetical protein
MSGRRLFSERNLLLFARALLARQPAAIDKQEAVADAIVLVATKHITDPAIRLQTDKEIRALLAAPLVTEASKPAPSVEQDERGALINEVFDRQQAGFDRCFEALGITDDRQRNWSSLVMAINDLMEGHTASPAANVAQGAEDPCPQCIPGGVCKTPTCGRLLVRSAGTPAQTAITDGQVAALRALVEMCKVHGDFSNGVTDATGSIDEGNVRAGEIIDAADKMLRALTTVQSASGETK